MAYTTINKSSEHFGTLLWTGDNTNDRDITGLDFTPSLSWIKPRSSVGNHGLFDAVRGADKSIRPNETRVEDTSPSNKDLDSFISGGIRVDQSNYIDTNSNGTTTVAWNWKANGAGSANTYGSINSTVSVDTTAGFSIVKWTGTGANATVGHGLGAVPKMIIVKNTTGSGWSWYIYHASIGATKNLYLNNNDAPVTDSSRWQDTTPTSSVFYLGSNGGVNGNGNTMIAYCFAEKTGYSKFGSYTGNGNADGSFVYTGFKPKFVLWKRTEDAGYDWDLYDTARDTYNVAFKELITNSNAVESSSTVLSLDILSNGFKLRTSNGNGNDNNKPYIFMAFGQSLVGSNDIPCTAR